MAQPVFACSVANPNLCPSPVPLSPLPRRDHPSSCRTGFVPVRILLETSRLQLALLGFRIQGLARARARARATPLSSNLNSGRKTSFVS
jgi:hypothetical protein